jgi:hypothetical protein
MNVPNTLDLTITDSNGTTVQLRTKELRVKIHNAVSLTLTGNDVSDIQTLAKLLNSASRLGMCRRTVDGQST